MKTTHPALSSHQDALADQFARRITRHLDDACDELPYDISERLRAARVQALAQRKREAQATQQAPAVLSSGSNTLVFGKGGHERSGWWNALVSAIPLIALVAGLVLIDIVQEAPLAPIYVKSLASGEDTPAIAELSSEFDDDAVNDSNQ